VLCNVSEIIAETIATLTLMKYKSVNQKTIATLTLAMPERYELESLGLRVKKINELNDLNEIRDLAEIIKQDKYVDYNTDYFNNGNPSL